MGKENRTIIHSSEVRLQKLREIRRLATFRESFGYSLAADPFQAFHAWESVAGQAHIVPWRAR
jgi:hypothetical protein